MTMEEIEELKGLAASMGLYDDKKPCKRAVILGNAIKALEQTKQNIVDNYITELGKIKEEIQGLIDFEESCCGNAILGYECLGVINRTIEELEQEQTNEKYVTYEEYSQMDKFIGDKQTSEMTNEELRKEIDKSNLSSDAVIQIAKLMKEKHTVGSDDYSNGDWECSNCGLSLQGVCEPYRFCPNCGKKMWH